ncbi:MAG: PEP-CTERM sorting domain-containing protein [Planctomycetaceae bacterium]
MTRVTNVWTLAVTLFALMIGSAGAAPVYSLIDLGELPGGANYSAGYGISANGVYVTGDSSMTTNGRAFRWDNGTGMTDLGGFPGYNSDSIGRGVNSLGQVVGGSLHELNRIQAFLLEGGTMTQLPGLTDFTRESTATGINDFGHISGYATDGFSDRAVRWTEEDGAQNLGGVLATVYSRGYAINDDGIVVGFYNEGSRDQAFLWHPVTGMLDLGAVSGGDDFSQAYGISNTNVDSLDAMYPGSVVGVEDNIAFLWTPTGGTISLGSIPGGRDWESAGLGVNIYGQVVGYSDEGPGDDRAFLWQSDLGMLDLTTLLDSSGAGWQLTSARAINDQGWIVGDGWDPEENAIHAYLLIPVSAVPEPSSLLLIGLGSIIAAGWNVRRWRRLV